MPIFSFRSDRARRWATRIAAAGVCAVAAACVFVTDACGCVHPPMYAFPVSGTVTRADGAPAPSAIVRANAFEGECPASDDGYVDVTNAFATTDATGRFRLEVRAMRAVATACIRVRAYREAGTAPALVIDRANHRIALDRTSATDSLIINITLPQ